MHQSTGPEWGHGFHASVIPLLALLLAWSLAGSIVPERDGPPALPGASATMAVSRPAGPSGPFGPDGLSGPDRQSALPRPAGLAGLPGSDPGAPTPLPAPASASWHATVSEDIRQAEYHLSARDSGEGWTAPNRAQGLRTSWQDGALVVTPRVEGDAWAFRYELTHVGRRRGPGPDLSVTREDVREGRIEWSRGSGLSEWYVNDDRGVEQGFTLHDRPTGSQDEPVVVAGRIEGLLAYASEDEASILLRTADGRDALRIRHLVVTDAADVQLPAWLAVGAGSIEIHVDDRDAVYPVTIDPLMTSPSWTAEGDQESAGFGRTVATAGDVNGDGYSDVIVGAFRYDNDEEDEGRAFAYHGSASGLSATPAWTAEGDRAGAFFGTFVATAGDVNGDGYSDVIVGALGRDAHREDTGRAFAYHGSAAGLSATPAWTAGAGHAGASFGFPVAAAGDVNGDGYSDVIVGAYHADSPLDDEGRVFAYHGSASGLSATADWTAAGDQVDAYFGRTVATAGDVNGDGYSDVIVGAYAHGGARRREGRAFAYHGSASGLSDTATWTVAGNQVAAHLGWSVATAGDVNGDGYSDVIVGADAYDDDDELDVGRALVYHGSASGLSPTADWTVEGDQQDSQFGWCVATAGDVNGDGYSDVIVGAPRYDNGDEDEGRAFAYHGSASGLSATAAWTAESDQATASFGISVATAGDVDGDGYSDVIVGARDYTNGHLGEGRAFLYSGSLPAPIIEFADRDTLTWRAVAGAVSYHVYRGTIPFATLSSRGPGPSAYDHACFEAGDAFGDGSLVTIDPELPRPGAIAFYYLVSCVAPLEEGSFGTASHDLDRAAVGDQVERPNAAPCP